MVAESGITRKTNSIRCYQCSSTDDIKGEDNCGAYEDFHREKHVAIKWDGRWRQVQRECASVAESGVTGICNWGVLENGVY
ncbi:hypothetical protein PGB90_008305 [Kerria lacca]